MAAAARGLLGLGAWGGSLGGEPRPGGGEPGFADARARRARLRRRTRPASHSPVCGPRGRWPSRVRLHWAFGRPVAALPLRSTGHRSARPAQRGCGGARARLNPTPLGSGGNERRHPETAPCKDSARDRRGKPRRHRPGTGRFAQGGLPRPCGRATARLASRTAALTASGQPKAGNPHQTGVVFTFRSRTDINWSLFITHP